MVIGINWNCTVIIVFVTDPEKKSLKSTVTEPHFIHEYYNENIIVIHLISVTRNCVCVTVHVQIPTSTLAATA